jgi:hypothetical protein
MMRQGGGIKFKLMIEGCHGRIDLKIAKAITKRRNHVFATAKARRQCLPFEVTPKC